MNPKTRTFRAAPGRVVTIPKNTRPGPGVTNMRLNPGETFNMDAGQVDRFVRRSLANGDLIEDVDGIGSIPSDDDSTLPLAAARLPRLPRKD